MDWTAQAVLDRAYGKPKGTSDVLPVVDPMAGERRAKVRAMIFGMLDDRAAMPAYNANQTLGGRAARNGPIVLAVC